MKNSEWVDLKELANAIKCKPETLRRSCVSGRYTCRFNKNGKYKIYEILLSSLPDKLINKYLERHNPKNRELSINNQDYSDVPEWSRKQADKYLELIEITKNYTRSQIENFLVLWNNEHPEKAVCYSSLYKAKIKYEKFGVAGLLSQKGQGNHRCKVDENYFEYYKSLYLREGAPSAFFCWQATLGYARETENVDFRDFPSYRTFDRLLKARVPEQAIYLARFGNAAWNKKFASFIPRDYSNLAAGSCWVSDHAQIDVAVNFNGSVCFPWVTVFRDVKTSKWLGWFLHAEAPNSDHIFQAFYYGVQSFGLPNDVYLDNGKDYRCKDFAGGREHSVKVNHNSMKENSLLRNIGINVHFALPYNAQTKPVERDFLKVKTFLSKGFVGYRGGKITERPEKLKDEIKNNKIMQFDEFKTLFDDFIINFLNKKPSTGKALKGKCPDELWAEEFKVKKVISKDALKLFCMRTSRAVKIGRNGIYDSKLEVTYWDEWMITEKGRKVYIRRDINAYQEAWVFDAETDEFLGKANMNHAVSFLAKTNVEKSELKKAIEVKNKEKKIIKSYLQTQYNPSNSEMVENLKRALDKTEFECKPVVSKITNTAMEQVVNIERQSRKNNMQFDYKPEVKPKKKLYLTEGERLRDLMKAAM